MNEDRQFMWFDLFEPDVAEAPPLRQDFAVVRRRGQPWLYLPLDRRAAAHSLALYPAQNYKARLAKRLLGVALRLASPRWLGLEIFSQAITRNDPFANYLSRTAGLPEAGCPRFAVLGGNPNVAGRRDIFLLFDAMHQPVAVVKAGHDDAARKLIAKEEKLLNALPPKTAGAPRLREGFSSSRVMALAMDFFPGESPQGDAAIELSKLFDSWLDTSREIRLAELPAWQRLVDSLCAEPLHGTARLPGDLRVRPTLMHGDFAPWNVKAQAGRWTVLDWERGELVGVPGWDWFHFVMQPAVLVRREATHALLARFEKLLASPEFNAYARRAAIAGHERPLALAYLTYCLRVIRQTEGMERIAELKRAAFGRWFSPELA